MAQQNDTFKAFRVAEKEGQFVSTLEHLPFKPLDAEELLVQVHYSALNYKDALSASGNKGVTRNYPHTPGIDAVGRVAQSTSSSWAVGTPVIVTSYDLGMNTDGGFAEYIKVPAAWAVKLPEALSMQEAMIYGTAGLTAGMAVLRLTELVTPDAGTIVVSGATGGVGSLAISILHTLGYTVAAITGKASEKDYLQALGAQEIILRQDIAQYPSKPLLKTLFAGAIDTVGGVILENIIKSTHPMGAVACCGNVASPKLDLTVFPFILRGVSLIGIDSQNYPMAYRTKVWDLLANAWKPNTLPDIYEEVTLEELQASIALMLQGKLRRKVLVKVGA